MTNKFREEAKRIATELNDRGDPCWWEVEIAEKALQAAYQKGKEEALQAITEAWEFVRIISEMHKAKYFELGPAWGTLADKWLEKWGTDESNT
jgi:hypothetical protein